MSSYLAQLHARRQQSRHYQNFTGEEETAPVEEIEEKVITAIVSAKDTASDGQVRIFRAAKGLDESYNDAQNGKVEFQESSHAEIKADLLSSPMVIRSMKITVNNETQLSKAITLIRNNAEGQETQRKFIPANHKSPNQFDSKMVEINNLNLVVDKFTGLEFGILKDAQATVQFKIGAKIDMANELSGKSAIMAS